jgi:hypothetical protein
MRMYGLRLTFIRSDNEAVRERQVECTLQSERGPQPATSEPHGC